MMLETAQSHNLASPSHVTLPLVGRLNETTPRSRVTPIPDAARDLEDPGVEATSNTTQLPVPSVRPAVKKRFVDGIGAFSLLKFLAAIAAVFVMFNVSKWHDLTAMRDRDVETTRLAAEVKERKEMSDKLNAIQAHISGVKDELSELKGENKLEPKIDPLQNMMVANVSLLMGCAHKHFSVLEDVMQSVRFQTRMPFETIIALSIPNSRSEEVAIEEIAKAALAMPTPFKVHIRAGSYFAGDNRRFLLDHATADVVSFFDCDDFMHPRRIEMIDRAFKSNSELEAALHGYRFMKYPDWNPKNRLDFVQSKLNDTGMDEWKPEWPYEYLWNQQPIRDNFNNKTWDVNDPTTEPNHSPSVLDHWYFPVNMTIPNTRVYAHNGWLSIRRRVANQVPYPTGMFYGEDSLYNWRLLKSHINFSVIQHTLGAYVFRT